MSDIGLSLETSHLLQIRHFHSYTRSILNLKIFLYILLAIGLFLTALQFGSCFNYESSLEDYMNYNDQKHTYLIHKGAEITQSVLVLCCLLVDLFAVLLESKSGLVVFSLFNLSTIIYTTCLPLTDHFWQIIIFLLILNILSIWLFYLITKRRTNYVVIT